MTYHPRISIVIPTYNGAQTLFDTLSSVQAQTFSDWQAIIIVDGSTDDTVSRFVESSFSRDFRFRLVIQKNMGVSRARNVGLDLCNSEYVAFLDHDDIWHPTKLERQYQFLEEERRYLACTCWYLTSKNRGGRYTHTRLFAYHSFDSMMQKWLSFGGNGPALASSLLMRHSSDLRFSNNHNAIGDLEFMTRLLLSGKAAVMEFPLLLYLQHKNQMHMSADAIGDYEEFYTNLHESTIQQFDLKRNKLDARVRAHLNLIQTLNLLSHKASVGTGFKTVFSPSLWNLHTLALILNIFRKRMSGYLARAKYNGIIKALWNS